MSMTYSIKQVVKICIIHTCKPFMYLFPEHLKIFDFVAHHYKMGEGGGGL